MEATKRCYCCREQFTVSHPEYPRLCSACGILNQIKRDEIIDLTGYYALVTGARIKIGYQTVLRLLRNGASVIATTRFPHSALASYAAEPDFASWKQRLFLVELDLLRVDLLGEFIEGLTKQIPHLDILINNAAQTVKDTYEEEQQQQIEAKLKKQLNLPSADMVLSDFTAHKEGSLINSALPIVPGSSSEKSNWVKQSADVSLQDLLEVQIINVTAPYLLAVGLKSLLLASPFRNHFIVNVSSLEGKFAVKRKSGAHPHTNMAKAALNMMTKTLATEYKKERIYLYSIDPGWVSKQFPKDWHIAQDYQLPLTVMDSAARLTQPLFDWQEADFPPTGIFLKDYVTSEW